MLLDGWERSEDCLYAQVTAPEQRLGALRLMEGRESNHRSCDGSVSVAQRICLDETQIFSRVDHQIVALMRCDGFGF